MADWAEKVNAKIEETYWGRMGKSEIYTIVDRSFRSSQK